MLDTMKAYNNMLEAGVEEKQAAAITKEIASAVNKGDLVTKEYLRAELLQTEKRLEEKINKNLWWMISTMIAMTGVIIAVLK